MEKQHLTYFKIENFKRFDSFEMADLGQFNLIVGDNNIGKTSVLEALTFDENLPQLIFNFYSTLIFRNLYTHINNSIIDPKEVKSTQFWNMIFQDINKKITIKLHRNKEEAYELYFVTPDQVSPVGLEEINKILKNNKANENLFKYQIEPWLELRNNSVGKSNTAGPYFDTIPSSYSYNVVPFIAASFSYGLDLVSTFYDYFNANKQLRRELESNLKQLIPQLEEVIVHKFSTFQEGLGVMLSDQNEAVPIQRFGEGTIRYARILMETIIAQSKRIMIDEIGNGIHFTRLHSFWKTIIQLCHKYQVQLFATTHSLECQQAFVEALEASDMQHFQKDARNISLIENKQGEVKAVTYDFEQFEYALNIGFNTRGGKL